jgi:hypothetical protein
MRVSDIYSTCLKAADLQGQDVNVTIAGGEVRTMEDGTRKLFLAFEELAAPLALNVTNARTIAALHGEEVTKWKGRTLVLFPTTTQFAGREWACIRIREQVPQLPEQPAPQQPATDGAVRF